MENRKEKSELIDKAVNWLIEHFYDHPHEKDFVCSESFESVEDMVEQFIQDING